MIVVIDDKRIKYYYNMTQTTYDLAFLEKNNCIIGYPLGNSFLTCNEFIDIISQSKSISYIESLMTTAIGDFYVFCKIDNYIYVISSPGCSGLFYNLENGILYLSDTIKELIKKKHSKIKFNDMEIVDAIIYGISNPFTTIENSIKRLSSAATLTIAKMGTYKIHGYLQYNIYQQSPIQYDLRMFDKEMVILEKRLEKRKSNISIMYSGGIDSAALICALRNLNITPVIYILEKDIGKVSTRYRAVRFCEELGLSTQIVVSDTLNDQYLAGDESCLPVFSPYTFNMYDEVAKYCSQKNMSELVISGESMDVLLGFGSIKRKKIEKYYGYIRECYKRYFHSRQFQKLLGFLSKFNSDIINNYFYSFLFRRKYTVPNFRHVNFPKQLNFVWNEYLEYKKEHVLTPMFPYGFNENGMNDIDFVTNRNAKIIKFYTYVSMALANIRHIESKYNTDILLPYAQGPVLKYLLNYQLKFNDIFFPKQFLLDYIKQKTGINYLGISTYPIQNLSIAKCRYIGTNKEYNERNKFNLDIVLDNIESYELKKQILKLSQNAAHSLQFREKIKQLSEFMSIFLN